MKDLVSISTYDQTSLAYVVCVFGPRSIVKISKSEDQAIGYVTIALPKVPFFRDAQRRKLFAMACKRLCCCFDLSVNKYMLK